MSLTTQYDPDNIFARIIRGEVPCVKLWETDDILVFMDVFPQSKGHCLVIHKKATATNLLSADDDVLAAMMSAVRKTAAAADAGLKPDGIRIMQFNGAPAGQTVYHLHFHVVPVFEGVPVGRHGESGPADPETLESIAAAIRAAL